MVKLRILLLLPAALLGLAAAVPTSFSAQAEEKLVGRSVTLAGRKVTCGKADIYVDRDLPSEGGAGDTILILNPDMMNQQPPTVRLFVFTHECGHITVGDSELDADCFAVKRGVQRPLARPQGPQRGVRQLRGGAGNRHPPLRQAPLRQPRSLLRQGHGRADADRSAAGAGAHAAEGSGDDHRLGARVADAQGQAPPSRKCCRLGAAPIRWT